tara:strand:+ start:233 stop:532 length:300 start_codon:yes stop_codon:yes gene_type:complete
MTKEEDIQQQIHDIESQYPNLHIDLHRDQFKSGDVKKLFELYKKLNKRENKMDDYFSEDNAVKFDQKNGTIDTLCFCRDKYLAEEIAKALQRNQDEDNE